jgi:CRISPR-associated protein Csh2
MAQFKNRVYGCAVIKAINSSYNADFSGQPRTLPNGVAYATDKAYKYSVKNYLKYVYPQEKIFYFKSLNDKLNPRSIDEQYQLMFPNTPKGKEEKEEKKEKLDKKTVAENLLSCLDVRCFGATFAGAVANVSIHGTVQVNHGVNIWPDTNIFTEQIISPFSNKANDPEAEKGNTTIGRQSRLEEGHYLHHFSINPANLDALVKLIGNENLMLSVEDINKLKEGMRRGASWYDSASKIGCENEMLVWIQLKEGSKLVLPSLATLVRLQDKKEEDKYVYDMDSLNTLLLKHIDDVEIVEIYCDKAACKIKGLSENVPAKIMDI